MSQPIPDLNPAFTASRLKDVALNEVSVKAKDITGFIADRTHRPANSAASEGCTMVLAGKPAVDVYGDCASNTKRWLDKLAEDPNASITFARAFTTDENLKAAEAELPSIPAVTSGGFLQEENQADTSRDGETWRAGLGFKF